MVKKKPSETANGVRAFSSATEKWVELIGNAKFEISQLRVFYLVAEVQQPTPQKDIREHTGLSAAAVTRNINLLVDLGLVDQYEDPMDKRSKFVELTPKGRQWAKTLDAIFDRWS